MFKALNTIYHGVFHNHILLYISKTFLSYMDSHHGDIKNASINYLVVIFSEPSTNFCVQTFIPINS